MIEATSLSFSYKKKGPKTLDDISFVLKEGDVSVLLGPNGAGKSTLISLLTGFNKPHSGEIKIEETPLGEMKFSQKSKLIGYVPQSLEFGDLSVFDTILLGRLPYFYASPCYRDKKATEDVIEKLGLGSFKDRNVNELSGGEKQLVGIAMALVKKPKILILDEPSSNLDLANELSLLRLVKKAAKEEGVAVLVSMHDLNQALLLGDHFLFLKKGRLISDVALDDIDGETLSDIYGVNIELKKDDGRINAYIKENL